MSTSRTSEATSQFASLYNHEFLRIASCVARAQVADPDFAFEKTLRLARLGDADGVALMLFPELGISSYAIDDLLFQDALLDAVERAIGRLAEAFADLYPMPVIDGQGRSRRGLSKWSPRYPRLTTWVEETIEYALTFFRLPRQHHKHLKSTNMLERLN